MAQAPKPKIAVDEARLALFSRAEYHERMAGRPTPTQSELDDIKHGVPVTKAPTGAHQLPSIHNRQQHLLAGPDPQIAPVAHRAPTPSAAPRAGGGAGTAHISSDEKVNGPPERPTSPPERPTKSSEK